MEGTEIGSQPLNPPLISATAAVYSRSYFKPGQATFHSPPQSLRLDPTKIHSVSQQTQKHGGSPRP